MNMDDLQKANDLRVSLMRRRLMLEYLDKPTCEIEIGPHYGWPKPGTVIVSRDDPDFMKLFVAFRHSLIADTLYLEKELKALDVTLPDAPMACTALGAES